MLPMDKMDRCDVLRPSVEGDLPTDDWGWGCRGWALLRRGGGALLPAGEAGAAEAGEKNGGNDIILSPSPCACAACSAEETALMGPTPTIPFTSEDAFPLLLSWLCWWWSWLLWLLVVVVALESGLPMKKLAHEKRCFCCGIGGSSRKAFHRFG